MLIDARRTSTRRPGLPRAVLFDMDGTLTRPLLDFDAIRRDLGVTGPILEALRHLPDQQLRAAHEVLDRHERAAAEASELNDGCLPLLQWLAAKSVPTALVTRNSRSSTRIILDRHALRFDIVLTREDEPAKPHPDSLRRALRPLSRHASEAWMVGDGSHDIEAAKAAGVWSIWISHGAARVFAAEPDQTIESLSELLPILEASDSPGRPSRV